MAIKMETGDAKFVEACRKAETPPTRRQWKKWRERRGVAWTKGRE